MNKYIGPSVDSFFEELGELEEIERRALKKGVTETIAEVMRQQKINKAQLAHSLSTSRSQLDRWLDPDDTSITLATLVHIAKVLGLEASFCLHWPASKTERAAAFLTKPAQVIDIWDRAREYESRNLGLSYDPAMSSLEHCA